MTSLYHDIPFFAAMQKHVKFHAVSHTVCNSLISGTTSDQYLFYFQTDNMHKDLMLSNFLITEWCARYWRALQLFDDH